MNSAPISSRMSAGLIVGLLVATPILFGVGLIQARWATSDVFWSEVAFFASWFVTFVIGLQAGELRDFLRRAVLTAALLTVLLPVESALLLGWSRAAMGVTGSVNAGFLLVGIVGLVGANALRAGRVTADRNPGDLAPLPPGGRSAGQISIAIVGAIVAASLASALLGLLPPGRAINGVTLGVLAFPLAGLAALFWIILAQDLRRCTLRLASVTIPLALLLAGVLW